jgi:hypothetical protein
MQILIILIIIVGYIFKIGLQFILVLIILIYNLINFNKIKQQFFKILNYKN